MVLGLRSGPPGLNGSQIAGDGKHIEKVLARRHVVSVFEREPAEATAAPVAAAAQKDCKVAQLYASSTTDKGSSWAHEQSFLAIQKELPWVDLSIRKDNVPSDNEQAVEDLIESMVQQGARVVYTTSPGFMESTRTVAARHPDVAFFNAGGAPGANEPLNVRIERKPDIGALYDERGQWFVSNVVDSPTP
jgi:basic membrane lipoprotein Med (substrate-binding protein (PBP1-ABC) superfamily)